MTHARNCGYALCTEYGILAAGTSKEPGSGVANEVGACAGAGAGAGAGAQQPGTFPPRTGRLGKSEKLSLGKRDMLVCANLG